MDPPCGFEVLGVPVTKAGYKGCLVAPDPGGEKDLLYFNLNQTGGHLFLLSVDPETGEWRQYFAPEGPGAWGYTLGPDGIIYLGTWDGGLILGFDPGDPGSGIRVLGRPSETESYIWMFALGGDGRLYGGTYGNAKLVYYDPKTGEMGDLGRMHPTQMYSRTVAAGRDGRIYIGIGTAEGDLVVYDPGTGKHSSILPAGTGVKSVTTKHGRDGHAYAQVGERWYRCENSRLVPVSGFPGPPRQRFRDGRSLESAGNGFYEIRHPDGRLVRSEFTYSGTGVAIFMVANGPLGRIYGSTAMPLELFEYDPGTGKLADLGNPTAVNGEIYSMAVLDDLLYLCAYPGSWLSVYDPGEPWNYGTAPGSNPRGIGYAGDGHLRPRAMVVGPDRRIYIGSLPPYGEHGGALGVYDPGEDSFVENFRHLIPDQSIVTLASDPKSGLIYGGSSNVGGGGTRPIEKDARLFAWDPSAMEKVLDVIPVEGDGSINAMAVMDGCLYFTSRPSNSVLQLESGGDNPRVVATSPGPVLDISLEPLGDRLVGLTRSGVIELNPCDLRCRTLEPYPDGINCGFATLDGNIFFGSGEKLVMYRASR